MSDNKRYYWLKLNEDFFEDDTVEWIEEQEGGEKYVLFYLKLCVKSIKNEGSLIRYVGDTLMPYDIKALAKLTNTDKDTVAVALKAFEEIGLIERKDTGEIYMKQIDEMIGTETDTAKRVRRHRAKQKALEKTNQMLQCNTVETKSNTEKEIEKEIEKELELEKENHSSAEAEQSSLVVDVINYLNTKANTNYKTTTNKTKTLIQARFNEGFTVEDFKTVIDIKTAEWLKDKEMNKYLRPETLFGTKFESYLNQPRKEVEHHEHEIYRSFGKRL